METKTKKDCLNEKYLEWITEIEAILCEDHNGEAYICGSKEVAVGNFCHKKEEYNVSCDNCEFRSNI